MVSFVFQIEEPAGTTTVSPAVAAVTAAPTSAREQLAALMVAE
jgi:hypothetical protein